MKRNITVQLDEGTIRKARLVAARRDRSISGLVADQIEALSRADDDYDRVAAEAIADMEKGFNLGGGPYPSREEIHER
jgi:hypothetical protein